MCKLLLPFLLHCHSMYLAYLLPSSSVNVICFLPFCCSVSFNRVQVNKLEYQPVNVEVRHSVRILTPGQQPDQQPRRDREPSLVWALAKAFGGTLIVAAFFKLGQDLLAFASPQILKYDATLLGFFFFFVSPLLFYTLSLLLFPSFPPLLSSPD